MAISNKQRIEKARQLQAERKDAVTAQRAAEAQLKAVVTQADRVAKKAELATLSADEKVRVAYLGMARSGMRHHAIRQILRIDSETYQQWRLQYPEWYEAVLSYRTEGREQRKQLAEDHLMMAIEQEKVDRNSILAAFFMLKAYDPETYGDGKRYQTSEGRQVEVVIRDSRDAQKAIPAEFTVDGDDK